MFVRLLLFLMLCSPLVGRVQDLYKQHCMTCHGSELNRGLGGSLLKTDWKHLASDNDLQSFIASGNQRIGMPAFSDKLSEKEIRSLVIYIQEQRNSAAPAPITNSTLGDSIHSEEESFKIERICSDLKTPWSMAFLPEGGFLVSERSGRLRMFHKGELSKPISGIPKVWAEVQGGLLEIALHPNYPENKWVYLTFSEKPEQTKGDPNGGSLKIIRGRIDNLKWIDQETIFEVSESFYTNRPFHFGTRLAFQGDYLFFSIGDRGVQENAQRLDNPYGKIHRIHLDGSIPKDNPFVTDANAVPSIWSYGNRNPQGLDFHPIRGQLWESEHGPRGGDEINIIKKGQNYGWPLVTFGMNYNGTPITSETEADGIIDPLHYWVPSIATCGIDFYEGAPFPNWQNDLFVAGLVTQELRLLKIEDGKILSDEVLLKNLGRVRDVASGPDGFLYVILNDPGQIIRLVPSTR